MLLRSKGAMGAMTSADQGSDMRTRGNSLVQKEKRARKLQGSKTANETAYREKKRKKTLVSTPEAAHSFVSPLGSEQ